MGDLILDGCAPAPLASYLKAIGALRVVAGQADPAARGWWSGDRFVLSCGLDAESLVEFFLDRYRPTPAVSPWNRASGFYPKDQRAAIERIERDSSPRLAHYREAITTGRAAVTAVAGLGAKEAKVALVARCRASCPDEALEWMDAALVLSPDGQQLQYPPLLLSGGNDGRLDFSNNFMQRLCDVLPSLGDDDAGHRERSAGWLRAALFGDGSPPLRDAAVGMFNPGGAGGANAAAGFSGASRVNPWGDALAASSGSLSASSPTAGLSRWILPMAAWAISI